MNILFDKSLKNTFMRGQSLGTDTAGYVIDATNKSRILDEAGEPIKTRDYAGLRKGSRIFLSYDIDTVIREAAFDQKRHE